MNMNLSETVLEYHLEKRAGWFLTAFWGRFPAASIFFLSSLATLLLWYFFFLRRRWQFYYFTVNSLFRFSPDAVMILDSGGKIIAVNRRFRKLMKPGFRESATGGKPGDPEVESDAGKFLEGTQLAELSPLVAAGKSKQGIMELLEDNQPVTVKYRLECLDNKRRHLGMVLILQDVTRLLEETRRTIWKFMAQNAAHRLKSPLQKITLAGERIIMNIRRGRTDPEKILEIQRNIQGTVQKMNEIIGEFLLVTEQRINPKPLDISSFLLKNIQYYQEHNLSEGISLKLELAPDLPLVSADEYHLLTVLVNLLDNSLKALQGEGTIEVKAGLTPEAPGFLRVTVSDNGVGISAEQLPRIFQHQKGYFENGHGIGLSVAQSIIQAHGGRITVESKPGIGTSFHVDIPLVE
jgi:signal transduction histidine kinase